MKKAVLFFLLFGFSVAYPQKQGEEKIDELKQQWIGSSDVEKINLSLELSKLYVHYNLDSCDVYTKKAVSLSKQLRLPEMEARSYCAAAFYFMEKNQLDEAIRQNNRSFIINKRIRNDKAIAYNYFIFGRIYQIKADYVAASKYYFPALKLSEQARDNYTRLLVYKNLAFLFLDQRDNKKALDYAFKANSIAGRENFPGEVGFCAGIIAEVYRSDEKNEEANLWFRKGYDYFTANKHEYGKAWILTNWSILFNKDLMKCLEIEFETQEIWDRISPNNVMSQANTYNIGFSYLYMYNESDYPDPVYRKLDLTIPQVLDKAEYYLLKSKAIAKKNNSAQWLMNTYYALGETYLFKGDISKYAKNSRMYSQIKDSLFSQEHKNTIASMESQQKMEAKDKEILLNKLTLEAKEKEKWFYILGIFSLLIIGFLAVRQSRNRKKTNEKLQVLNGELDEANKTKARFFSILNHDLRSPVSSLISFLHLQKESPELLDAESKTRLENKTISSAENLLESMEDILLWSKGQMENFKPMPENIPVNIIFTDLKRHFSNIENVNIIFENPENISLFTDENYLKTILRNLTANAIKALEKTENATVILTASTNTITVSDNGPGGTVEQFKALYDEKEVIGIKSGLGLHLIRDLAKAIGCKITVDTKTGEGTIFSISLP